MSLKTLTAMGAVALTLTACASTSSTNPVIMRADSTLETTGLGETKLKAQEVALTTAKKQCGGKSVVVIEDQITYNGVLDEKTGRVIEQGMGVVGAIFGNPIGLPKLSRNDDYEYQLKFQCR